MSLFLGGYAEGLIFLSARTAGAPTSAAGRLAAGLAFLYHPPTTAPFWGMVLLVFVADRNLRVALASPAAGAVYRGTAAGKSGATAAASGRAAEPVGPSTERMMELQHFRTRYAWVSLWAGLGHLALLAICVLALWGTSRIWPLLSRELKWFFVGLPIGGVLCIPFRLFCWRVGNLHYRLPSFSRPVRCFTPWESRPLHAV